MLYYIPSIFVFITYIFYFVFENKKVKFSIITFSYIILCVFFCYVAGFRDISIGTDTLNYYKLFYNPEDDLELGFVIISNLIKFLGGEFNHFILFYFILSFSLKFISVKKMSYFPLLPLAVYSGMWFLVYDINGIRQGFALGIICFSFYLLLKERIFTSILFSILAVFFHTSAIVFLPFYLITKVKCSSFRFFMIFIVSVLMGYLNVIGYIIDFLSEFQNLNFRLINRAIDYKNNESFNENIFFSFKTFSRVFILFSCFYLLRRMKISEYYKNVILWGMLLSVCSYLVLSQFEIIAVRTSLYFRLAELFFWGSLPLAFKGNISKLIAIGAVCLYSGLNVFQTLELPNNNLYPYKSSL